MRGTARFVSVSLFFCATVVVLLAEKKEEPLPTEPQALYIFPVSGQQGSTIEVTIEGQTLADTYAVWTDCQALEASVKRVVETDRKVWQANYLPENQLTHEVTLRLKISPSAELGGHTLRLVSPLGVSNPMPFRVSSRREPLISEDESRTGARQPIVGQSVEYPVVINGKIGRILGGETDYYSFDAEAGRELYFETFFPDLGGKMLLYLYEPSPSWVDPHRLVQLAFNDDPIGYERGLFGLAADQVVRARLKHRFTKSGRYLVAVKAYDDRGGPGFVYQLRIASPPLQEMASDNRAWPLAHPVSDQWKERRFNRPLSATHLAELSKRTVLMEPEAQKIGGKAGSGVAGDVGDDGYAVPTTSQFDPLEPVNTYPGGRDPEGSQDHVPMVELPATLEGTIDRPGKTDYFRLKVEAGQGLAVEVRTPREGVPRFSPWVKVLDGQGEVLFSSVYNRVEGNNVQLFRYLEPKMVYRFEQDGEYTLQIRDLTSRYSGSQFSYSIMIRPQIPHIGELELDVERVNLSPGEAKRLTVTADREEGFAGEIALSVENLPSGVEAYPTAVLESYRPPPFDEGQKKVFRPEAQKVSITLIADEGASTTRLPRFLRVKARPVVNGVPGPEIAVGEVPLMVVAPLEVTATKGGE